MYEASGVQSVFLSQEQAMDYACCLHYYDIGGMLVLIGCTLVLGVITGFLSFRVDFSWRPFGQIIHGLLSIGCFGLVGAAFWRFGWKIGVLDLFLVFVAGKIGLSA